MLRYVTFLLLLCATTMVSANNVELYTGSKIGTYHSLARDMQTTLHNTETHLIVHESNGSLDNIQQMRQSEGVAVGVVQSDVLGFLRRAGDKNTENTLADHLRLVMPLYKEEVHIIANKSIRSIYDLHGKRVVVGPKGSGSWLTAMNIFSSLNIKPSELRRKPPEEGVVEVLKGTSDAMFYVAGKPVRLFRNVEQLADNEKFDRMLDTVHFVPIEAEELMDEYTRSVITSSDYNYVSVDVPTIAVTAMLVSYSKDYAMRQAEECTTITFFADNLRESYDALRQDGHPKWQEVDFDAELGYWEQDLCAKNNNIVHDLEQELLGVIGAAP